MLHSLHEVHVNNAHLPQQQNAPQLKNLTKIETSDPILHHFRPRFRFPHSQRQTKQKQVEKEDNKQTNLKPNVQSKIEEKEKKSLQQIFENSKINLIWAHNTSSG